MQLVMALLAQQHVIAGIALEMIIPGSRLQMIIAVATGEPVGTGPAVDEILALFTGKDIVTVAAD